MQNPTNRHHYIFDVIFKELCSSRYQLVSDISECHINYSSVPSDKIDCIPYGLLEENGVDHIHKEEVRFEKLEKSWCFYKTGTNELSYDLFSASFFLLSRYEEYLPFEADAHNRFPAEESVLLQQDKLGEPLVNQWIILLKSILENKYDELSFEDSSFSYLSTLDIDQAWKFKHKGALRSILGTIRDFKQCKWENFKDRWPVLLGLKADPFYQYDWNTSLEHKYHFETLYFFLLGDYSEFDKNISHKNKKFRHLIRSVSKHHKVGIHPSYLSNNEDRRVKLERNRLARITSETIEVSRQHFLMQRMPKTYRNLLSNGIKEDHTLGYSTHLGFRAGIASAFSWFDLEINEATDLKLVPFCAMDITPLHYRKESPDEAIQSIAKLMSKVKEVNGLFVSLWHNESLSETERWKGWRRVYESMIKDAQLNL